MLTLANDLDQFLLSIPPGLLPAASHQPLRSLSGLFPSALSRCFDLECRLGSDPSMTDFLFCVTRAERAALAAPDAFSSLDDTILTLPLWQRIRRFIQAWADPVSPLFDKVIMLWFEFDQPAATSASLQAALSAPGFFFGSRDFPTAGDHAPIKAAWLYDLALPLISGGALSPGVLANLHKVSVCLPDGAHIYQMGAFYARALPQLRVCLTGIRPEHIPGYLRAIGCPAGLLGLEPLLSDLDPLGEIHLDLDVGEQIGAKIGLECSRRRGPAGLAVSDARLLSWLESRGLCAPEKQAALLAFPGVERLPRDGDELSPKGGPALLRDLSHIKIVYHPGQPLQAKAYLQINRLYLDDLALAANRLAFMARRQAAKPLPVPRTDGEA